MCSETRRSLRNDAFTMFLIVLCLQFFVQVLSEAPPAPPQNIHVDKWLLTWTPATEEGNVTYTVQYSSFNSNVWTDVPACIKISLNSCQVLFTKAKDEHGCVKLQVRAERNGLTSIPVEACSQHGDSCTPKYNLTARPGTLTVHLSRNHNLAFDHADHAKHRVYYGKEGESLKDYKDGVSSVTISGLQEGQRYCMRVQHIVLDCPVGLSSCAQCELIPESKSDSKQTGIIVVVVLVLLMVIFTPVMVYFLLFQRGKIKKCFKSPCKIPSDFLLEPFSEQHPHIYTPPSDEHCNVVTLLPASPERSSEYERRLPQASALQLLSVDQM